MSTATSRPQPYQPASDRSNGIIAQAPGSAPGGEPSAATKLEGQFLPGGWHVTQRIEQPLDATGGHFSVGYLVERDDGTKGFLKALDYAKAFRSQDRPISIALQELTESINFEKYVLARCRDRRLDRIVISIADGTIAMREAGIDTVEYLIFELADGDARKQMTRISQLDIAWRLNSLHHIATGLEQLHRNGIVHQDLKPSNVLVFRQSLCKLADLGRAACEGQAPPHSTCPFAGDYAYAPPDVLYRFALPDLRLRQLSFDAYLLGSMATFFFTGHSATALLLSELHPTYANWQHFGGTADDITPHLTDAFTRVLKKVEQHVTPRLAPEILGIVRQLCEPDPNRRGHPEERRGIPSQFSLQRYVSKFDLLLKRAELGLFKSTA